MPPLPHHDPEQPAPLSYGQQQLWFLSQMLPDSSVYNTPIVIEIPGTLNEAALKKSLQAFSQRHYLWSSSFPSHDGIPLQVVEPCLSSFSLPVTDLSSLPAPEQLSTAHSLIEQQARLPFNLSQAPLWRAFLLRFSSELHWLCLIVHHLICDGHTVQRILLPEISHFYHLFCNQSNATILEPAAHQYADYALWQQSRLSPERLQELSAFWKRYLQDAPTTLALPTDRPRPARQSFRGSTYHFTIAKEEMDSVRSFSQQEGCSLYTVLLTAFQILLYRYSRQEDFLIGIFNSDRHLRPEFESIPGYFLNTLVLRSRLSDTQEARELVKQTWQNLTEVLAHGDMPFHYLVQRVLPERDLSQNPLFQVAISLAPAPAVLPNGWRVQESSLSSGSSRFDLSLILEELPDGSLHGSFEYSRDLFEEETIVRLARHWQTLLSSLVSSPSCPLASLQLLSHDELHQLLVSFNPSPDSLPPAPVPAIHLLFEAQVLRSPSSCALLQLPSGSSLSYLSLNSQANQLARLLLSLGLSPDSPVAILLPPSPSFFIALFAVLKAGSFYLPLEPSTPPARLSALLSHIQPSFLLTSQSLASSLPALPPCTSLLCLDSPSLLAQLSSLPSDNLPWSGSPDQLAYLIFTSGSTGSPKAVSISHANLLASTLSRLLYYRHLPPSRFLLLSPCSFDSSVAGIFWSLCSGATLVLPPSPLSDHLLLLPSLLQQAHISHLLAVPSLYRFLLEHSSPSQLSSLRCCIVAGEPCPRSLVLLHFSLLPHTPLFNEYGPSETTVWASVHPCSPSDPFPISPIGRPLPHCRLYVLDPSLQPVPIGVPGQLFIGGPSVSPGYFRQPALSSLSFLPDPFSPSPNARLYRTGDLVRWLPDGSLLFLGRLDQQVKLRGFRIDLTEIEAVLSSHPSIQEAAVLLSQPSPSDPSSSRLVAFVSLRHGSQLDPSSLRSFLSDQLPPYMIPTSFVFLETLPHTSTGKVDRLALAALPLPESRETASNNPRPSTPVETALIQLWEEVLNTSPISTSDNFFSLGGHSLLAARLFARVEQCFGVKLSLSTLFTHPTVEELAKAIEEMATTSSTEAAIIAAKADAVSASPLPHHDPEQPAPLSYGQQQLWFLSQMLSDSPAYNVSVIIEISDSVDANALQQSLHAFLQRHHLWRSAILSLSGSPALLLQPCPSLPLPLTDLSSLPAEEQLSAARSLIEEQVRLPFNLSQPPLLRAFLLRLSDQRYWLCLIVHHIIADAQTLYSILPSELQKLYESYASGHIPDLPAPRYQYADYALWEEKHLSSERLEQLLSFWREYLQNAPTTLALPVDHQRPSTRRYHGSSYYFSLPPELVADLKKLAGQEGVSLYTVLIAAFQILLYRYSSQEDFLIGTFTTNRHKRPELEEIPGYFLNAIPLRSCIADAHRLSGHELIQRTRKALAAALAHDDLPLPLLVRHVFPQRLTQGDAPFQVAITMNSYRRLGNSSWQIQELAIDTGASRFDLTLSLEERSDGTLHGCFEYSRDLFEEETIVRLARHWQTLLSSLVSSPSCPLASLQLLSHDELHQLLVSFNPSPDSLPPAPVPAIHLLFEAQVLRSPSSCALLQLPSGSSLSYLSLNSQANQLARLLLSLGITANTPVPLLLPASSAFIVALLAVLKAGACFVPLDPETPTARLQAMLTTLQPTLLLTTQSLAGKLPALTSACTVVYLDAAETQSQLASLPSDNLPWSGSPDQLAYLIFTSGSTGSPKAVSISHANLMASFTARLEYYKALPPRVHAPLLSLSFDSALTGVLWTLCEGGKVVLLSEEQKRNLSKLPALLQQFQVSHLLVVPSLYRHILEYATPSQLASLRCVLVGGEACPRSLVLLHFSLLPHTPLFNEYGPSETTVWASVHPCSPSDPFPISPIGRPLPHCRLYVLDPSLQPVPIGVPGQLFIGGPSVSPGYFRQPALSSLSFLPDPFSPSPNARLYRTGDLVRWLPDGSLLFLGRLDQQVKLRGFRIDLTEIEAVLSSHPSIQEAAVLLSQPSPSDPSSSRLVAFVSLRHGSQLDPSSLRSFLSDQLPPYMIPTSFVFLETLPHTSTGKVDRLALAALPLPEGNDTREQKTAPRNLLEQKLTQLWEELLNVQPIGVRDNFFELGGHSLLAARLFARIEEHFGRQLPLSLFFEEPTIERLARAIEDEEQQRSRTPVIAVHRKGKKRPLFYLHGDWTGGAFYCIELARLLGEDQPFYAVEPYRFAEGTPPPSFEAMAAAHIEAIRQIQPHGPYRLAGWCNGGLVAYEMARQLQANGEQVELLVLIDPTAPEQGWSRARLTCSFIRVLGTLLGWDELQQIECFRKWRYRYSLWRYRLARLRQQRQPNADEEEVGPALPDESHQRWTSTCSWILTRYRSGPYYGDLIFFWAAEDERWRRKPWESFARRHQQEGRGRVESRELPGTHITSRTTYLEAFATELKRCLEAVDKQDLPQTNERIS
uniref:Carrier domain-containing protein n=1 Tax=Thermogemmatispora argillosa TaxID=2045280 RepID=A0A455T8K7_9CHLR|nr:hypothetical protein KTA_38840 [Thermogemmatispora argillosa]